MEDCKDVAGVDYSGSGYISRDIYLNGVKIAEAIQCKKCGVDSAIEVEKANQSGVFELYEEKDESVQVLNALATKIKRECASPLSSEDTAVLANLVDSYTRLLNETKQ